MSCKRNKKQSEYRVFEMKFMKVLQLMMMKLPRMMIGEGMTGVTLDDNKQIFFHLKIK